MLDSQPRAALVVPWLRAGAARCGIWPRHRRCCRCRIRTIVYVVAAALSLQPPHTGRRRGRAIAATPSLRPHCRSHTGRRRDRSAAALPCLQAGAMRCGIIWPLRRAVAAALIRSTNK